MSESKNIPTQKPPNIMIVGCGRSGKSSLAMTLSQITGLRVIHIDLLTWKPGWVKRSQEDLNQKIQAAIKEDGWIFEGDNAASFHLRAERSRLIIFLDFPRHICLWRVILRTIKHYGKPRSDLYEGCYERFNREYFNFLKWVWNFNKNSRPKILRLLNETQGDLDQVTLKSPKDVQLFLETFRQDNGHRSL